MFAALLLALSAAAEEPAALSHDGLERVAASRFDELWLKPGVDLSDFDRVRLLPASVAFRRHWAADQYRATRRRVPTREVERIRSEMASLFRRVFAEELSRDDGYSLVEVADAGVLAVRAEILDLDITDPDVPGTTPSRSHSISTGSATLVLELHDAASGEILARAVDRREARHAGTTMLWSGQARNRAEAEAMLSAWARRLRQRLDEARAGSE